MYCPVYYAYDAFSVLLFFFYFAYVSLPFRWVVPSSEIANRQMRVGDSNDAAVFKTLLMGMVTWHQQCSQCRGRDKSR